ncbi:MAG TPA: YciI family protein [Trebonia sp.]|nr:YciI family protein [Trebonia sp.]
MKYVMLILNNPSEPAQQSPEWNAWFAEVSAWYEKWGATGKLDGGHQLQPPQTAKTVRATGVTDGPFIETKEALGGYSVIEADSMDEAVEVAKTWPGVDRGWITIELRAVIEMG